MKVFKMEKRLLFPSIDKVNKKNHKQHKKTPYIFRTLNYKIRTFIIVLAHCTINVPVECLESVCLLNNV